MPAKLLARKAIYKSPWVNLYVDRVRNPDGSVIEKYHALDFEKDGVAALVENAKKEILLIRPYRYLTRSVAWEVPAGRREKGESVITAARREVFEETGYQTTRAKRIYSYHPIIGISNLAAHVVFCRAGKNTGHFDRNEVREFRWFSRNEVQRMIQRKLIRDGFALTTLLLYLGP